MSQRPDVYAIKEAYTKLFLSDSSPTKLRQASSEGRLSIPAADGLPGRGLAWKLFLHPDEPLQSPHTFLLKTHLRRARQARQAYIDAIISKMRAPDGSYEEGLIVPEGVSLASKSPSRALNLSQNNPLSLDEHNPWRDYFTSVELRKTIRQDVERTFPEIAYFRDPDIQSQLTTVLFLHSASNPQIGYRQGMHELLAPLFYALDYDSIAESDATLNGDDDILKEICSRNWVAADAWSLFGAVMNGVGAWYEWRDPTSASGGTADTPVIRRGFSAPGQLDIKPYVSPIVRTCNRIHSIFLKGVDPALWESMDVAGIEPQIYGMRWLRLLFTREFSMKDAMTMWDGLFASGSPFELAEWVCVAMLLRIRNKLLDSDYNTQLMHLLHYPQLEAVASEHSSSPTFDIDPTSLLVRQAAALRTAPTVATGSAIMLENRNLLNIPIEAVADPLSPLSPTRGKYQTVHRPTHLAIPSDTDARPKLQPQQVPAGQHSPGLPEMIARNILDRGESLGINKTLMNAVSEIRRNLPVTLARVNLGNSSAMTSFSFPDDASADEVDEPRWEARVQYEIEKEMAGVHALHVQLADSLSLALEGFKDIPVPEAEDVNNTGGLGAEGQARKNVLAAIECVTQVRDILAGSSSIAPPLTSPSSGAGDSRHFHSPQRGQDGRPSSQSRIPPSMSATSNVVHRPSFQGRDNSGQRPLPWAQLESSSTRDVGPSRPSRSPVVTPKENKNTIHDPLGAL